MLANLPEAIFLCPVCKSGRLAAAAPARMCCANSGCQKTFPIIDGRPALIDFANSVVDQERLLRTEAADTGARPLGWRRKALQCLFGADRSAAAAASEISRELGKLHYRPRLLVVGGGTVGLGAEGLYANDEIDMISFDIYASPNVQLIADAHSLPFSDAAFDAVWIQAVLEHVLEPELVVAEIHRVLMPDGLVYAGTPFMQQVHEGPYDFMRFTESGHRWLFRRFERLASGATGGPGAAAVWSFRYLVAGLFRSRRVGRLAAAAVFWLQFIDYLVPTRFSIDSACGVWLLGRKAQTAISPREAIAVYRGAQR